MLSGVMFDKVIVGVGDEDAGRDAVGLATLLGCGQQPPALAYVERVALVPADSAAASQSAECRRAMQRFASLAVEAGVGAELSCVQAPSVASGLHELAASRHADLLVIGASGGDELDRALVSDDTREVLSHAPCAVAVAPTGFATRPPIMRRIGVAYDDSPESEQALALARRIARERDVALSAFHAVPEPLYSERRPTGARLVHDPWSVQAETDEAVEKARSQIAQLGDLEPVAASGDPAKELARYAESVDLLIIGSHRYRPLELWMFDRSTAQQLADSTPCPLLVLPSEARCSS
jgi:nucleotide-binding universal stress UspA family protein